MYPPRTSERPDSGTPVRAAACHRIGRLGALVATVVALSLGLAACGNEGGDPAESPSAAAPGEEAAAEAPGEVSDLSGITVSGDFGESAEVDFEPFTIAETTSQVVTEGEGANTRPVEANDLVSVHYQGVNARTGEVFDESYPTGEPAAFPLDQVVPGFSKGLTDKHEGDRVLIAMPGPDGYDSAGGNPAAGIEVGDTLVFVVDIVSAPLSAPAGEQVTQPEDQPQVSGPVDDPQVDASGDAPEDLLTQTLITGTGPEVSEESTITVDYRSWVWGQDDTIDDTYGGQPETGQLAGLIPGWVEGLQGQTKGSRVLLVVPPDKAYPDGDEAQGIPADATMIYIIDILQVA